jgi:hypothetical protein
MDGWMGGRGLWVRFGVVGGQLLPPIAEGMRKARVEVNKAGASLWRGERCEGQNMAGPGLSYGLCAMEENGWGTRRRDLAGLLLRSGLLHMQVPTARIRATSPHSKVSCWV